MVLWSPWHIIVDPEHAEEGHKPWVGYWSSRVPMAPLYWHLPASSRSRPMRHSHLTTQHHGLHMRKGCSASCLPLVLILVVSGTFQAPRCSRQKLGSHPRLLILHQPPHPISPQVLSSTPPSAVLSLDWHCFNVALSPACPELLLLGSLNWSVCLPAYSPTPCLACGCHYLIPQCIQFKTLTYSCVFHTVSISHRFSLPASPYSYNTIATYS